MHAATVSSMKTLWNGSLELGELVIPVGLAATVSDRSPRFRRLHVACSTPVAHRPWCDRDQQLLDETDIAAAWEVAPGEFLVLTDDERAALEPVESRRMPIDCFVPAGEIDELLVRKRYQLVPSKTTIGRRGYQLLAAAISDLQVAGLVRFVAWRGEQLATITSDGDLLQLATLHFTEDLLARPTFDPVDQLDDRLHQLARELVTRHTRKLRCGDLDSLDRPLIRRLLDAKLAGEPIIRPAVQEDERATVASLDLETTLQRSLKKAPRRRSRRTAATATG